MTLRRTPLAGTPYFFCDRRIVREARLAAYIRRQHRAGRTVAEILGDPYVARCGSRSLAWSVLVRPEMIAALGDDVAESIRNAEALVPQRYSINMASPKE